MAPHTTEVHEMGLLTPDQSSVSERRKQSPWYAPHGWLLEILSMIASLCCTLALAFLLFAVQDKPYENWRSYVGLNPTISILTTVARATLLLSASACLSQGKWLHLVKRSKLQALEIFDQASRGPLGALKIVLKTRAYLGLPTLAAAITVLALAIGPFTQQVVQYDQGSVLAPSPRASYDYAHNYSSGAPMFATQEGFAQGLNGPTGELHSSISWDISR
jgi:succinate dehydrogenase hydrophobic anchor subunit